MINSTATATVEGNENSINIVTDSQSTKTKSVAKKPVTDYKLLELLGYGPYSEVYAVVEKSSNCIYAIKKLNKRQIIIMKKMDSVQRERSVMIMLNDVPGFVNLMATCQDYNSLYLVMTYAKNGDLQKALEKFGAFHPDCVRHYAAELLLACEQMHQRNILHLDIKVGNILLDEEMHTLITDFGSTRMYSKTDNKDSNYKNNDNYNDKKNYHSDDDNDEDENNIDAKTNFGGTVPYIAPELLTSNTVTPLNDLWALGCFIYETLAGLPPFRGLGEYDTLKKICALDYNFPVSFDETAKDLVQKLLTYPAKERLGANDENCLYTSIRSHPFFASIDFEKVRQIKPPQLCPYLPCLKIDLELTVPIKGVEKKQLLNRNDQLKDKNFESNDDESLTDQLQHKLTVNTTAVSTITTKIADDDAGDKSSTTLRMNNIASKKLFTGNEDIIKKSLVNKWKGLFSTKYMLLLTSGPHLMLIDPMDYKKREEIEWTEDLLVEVQNAHVFLIYTPKTIYYIEDTNGCALEWTQDITKVHESTFQQNSVNQK